MYEYISKLKGTCHQKVKSVYLVCSNDHEETASTTIDPFNVSGEEALIHVSCKLLASSQVVSVVIVLQQSAQTVVGFGWF